uniref:MULE transposase domain-containing protein n=1 Tax=Schizaphis graminum TaxID=13262 RepID=A0A2S2P4T0_SCHGA
MNITTNKDENFLFCNDLIDNIIGFSTDTNLKALCDVTKVYMDGTFKSCTKYFLQLFTIHGFRNGLYVPLVFLILPNKTLETYTKAFQCIVSYCTSLKLNFQPTEIFVDFEVAIHMSVKCVWPNAIIRGCRFHLAQSWWRKIQQLGLSKVYKSSNNDISDYLKCVFGLPFLKPEEVFDCFIDDLMTIKPVNTTVDKFCDYLLKTYIEQDALFPPNIWAEFAATTNRTTNSCESYHAKLNASISAAHPNIFVLIEILLGIQSEIYVSLRSSATQPVKKTVEKENFLREKMLSFTSGELTRLNFVKEVSFKFIP